MKKANLKTKHRRHHYIKRAQWLIVESVENLKATITFSQVNMLPSGRCILTFVQSINPTQSGILYQLREYYYQSRCSRYRKSLESFKFWPHISMRSSNISQRTLLSCDEYMPRFSSLSYQMLSCRESKLKHCERINRFLDVLVTFGDTFQCNNVII